jgi:gag-polypeptide of LTR copia-type
MGPEVDHMSNLNMNSNSDSTTLSVPKLRDDGSNWADYQPRIERALGSKGLWRHVLGAAIAPKLYILLAGVPVIADGKTPATEEQIEAKEAKIQEYERKEYLAQHVILSTTSTRIGSKIKNMMSANKMWEAVKADATMKSSLYLLDAEDQLASMKLVETDDAKTHLDEMKQHFQLMVQHRDNLTKMGSELSDTRFNTIIMASLPESYRPTLQTITAAEKANALTGQTTNRMKADDLIAFLIEEAQHRIINAERSKNSEQALAAYVKKKGKGKPRERAKGDDKALSADSNIICHNCKEKATKRVIAGLKEVVKRVKVHIRERERKLKQRL